MAAIPLAAPVQRDHQQVRPRQRLEQLGRPVRPGDGVAQSTGELVQHGRAGSGTRPSDRAATTAAPSRSVIGHHPSSPRQRERGRHLRRHRPPAPPAPARYSATGQPSVRAAVSSSSSVTLVPAAATSARASARSMARSAAPTSRTPPARPQGGERQRGLAPRGDRRAVRRRHVRAARRRRRGHWGLRTRVGLVEHQGHRSASSTTGRPPPGERWSPDRAAVRHPRAEQVDVDGLDPVDAAARYEQDGRIVVARVERHGGDRCRSAPPIGPTGVDLPEPGGPVIDTTVVLDAPSSRSTSAARYTVPARLTGSRSFQSA